MGNESDEITVGDFRKCVERNIYELVTELGEIPTVTIQPIEGYKVDPQQSEHERKRFESIQDTSRSEYERLRDLLGMDYGYQMGHYEDPTIKGYVYGLKKHLRDENPRLWEMFLSIHEKWKEGELEEF